MGSVSGKYPSFIGGVSQQDSSVRLPTQLESAENCWFDPALGAGKRPPAEFVQVLGSDIPTTAAFHTIKRDANEHYLVVVYDNTIRVFDHITGHEYTVVVTDDNGYLSTSDRGADTFRLNTVADTTFIVNRNKVVKMASAVAPGFISASVQTFEDLPDTAPAGTYYQITGDPDNGFDTFYVQSEGAKVFNEVAKPGDTDTLDKYTMPHVMKRIPDEANPDGFYFSYGPIDWDLKPAGDSNSNPPPSFVGETISNVFYMDQRLGFLSVNNVIMSEVKHPFNFWRTTITQILASDPIDVEVQMAEVAILQHAIPYQHALLLFSEFAQFQLGGSDTMGLSPQTVHVDPITPYSNSALVAPVLSGDSINYLSDHGLGTTVREYFVQVDNVTGDAADITGHVPSYIPSPSRSMAAVSEADAIVIARDSVELPQLSVYQSRWDGDKQSQAAWNKWRVIGCGQAVHVSNINGQLYVVLAAQGGGVEMVKFDLTPQPVMALVSSQYNVHLDRRTVVTPVYTALGNYTEITLPYDLASLDGVQIVRTTDWSSPGSLVDMTNATLQPGGQSIRFPGNIGTGRVVVGLQYNQTFTLTRPYIKDNNGSSVLIGRLQLRKMTLAFANTAYFTVTVGYKARTAGQEAVVPALLSTYTGRTIGDSDFILNAPNLASGTFAFPVYTRADIASVTIGNDSIYPSWFQSAQWEGLFTARSSP